MANAYLTKKKHFENRFSALKEYRTRLEPEWKEIRAFLAPDTGCFDNPVTNKKSNKDPYYTLNINTLPMYYINNLSTAMVSNLTPSRLKWFRLSVEDETRDESIWLLNATNKLYRMYESAGLYENLYGSFKEAILYGGNILGVQRDSKTGFRFIPMTAGEYWTVEGEEGVINSCYRNFALSNIQLLEKFGRENLPDSIINALDRDNTEELHTVVHCVEPNPNYLPQFKNYNNKPYLSVYYLEDDNSDRFLDYRTTSFFPFMCARWERVENSPYGVGLGRQILGDVKSLQAYERDLAKANKKMIDPPLRASTQLKNAIKDASANGITYTDDPNGVLPLYNVNYATREALENITRITQRIYQLTYNDLFYALLNKDKSMSATEAQGIQQEKMTMLGSVVERLQTEFLKNLVETTFAIAYQDGWLGKPPESLIGKNMRVEYTSLLAMSQDINDLSLVERYLRFVSSIAGINPIAARKPDVLAMCDFYAKRLGVDQSLNLTNDVVEEQETQAQMAMAEERQAQIQQQNLIAQAKAAKDMAQAQTISGGALEEVYGGPRI